MQWVHFKHFPYSNVPGTLTDARDTAKRGRPGLDLVTLQVAGERETTINSNLDKKNYIKLWEHTPWVWVFRQAKYVKCKWPTYKVSVIGTVEGANIPFNSKYLKHMTLPLLPSVGTLLSHWLACWRKWGERMCTLLSECSVPGMGPGPINIQFPLQCHIPHFKVRALILE